jgi:hypothetical protein
VALCAVQFVLGQRVQTEITKEGGFRSVVERAEALPPLVTGVGVAANVQIFASADVEAVLASKLQRCLHLHLSTLK